ncbi:MAG: DUF5977 domain-containing protein [Bacteroidota bacterium]|nr:DUF5977 domain-containing protein [Bacteroidota bacterium]
MNRIMLRYFTILTSFSLVFFSKKLAAQEAANTIGDVSISSPTAASLGKYGDIPVNYHTGIPQISIPIYTVEAGSLKLPISLNYHAAGLKVQEVSSWVGAGWSLDAGGVITRTVQGQPDESGTNSGTQLNGHFSHYGFNNYLYQGGQEDWQGFSQGRKDGEPDFFFFNFAGYSGKFYFRDDRTPIIVPQQDLKIIPSYSGGRSIDYFTVVVPNGDQYVFGNSPGVTGATPIETTNPVSLTYGSSSFPPTSAWYLNKIISADGLFSITLTYVAEAYGSWTTSMFPVDPNLLKTEFDLVKNVVQGVRLSQISFPNGIVSFNSGQVRTDLTDATLNILDNANTASKTLGSIRIQNNNGFCKKDSFYYGYFSGDATALPLSLTAGNTITSDQYRLRLDSVQETSCDLSAQVPPYRFSYFMEQVPRVLSFGIDHWGFCNGVNSNTGLIPTYTVDGTPHAGANRDAAWPAMRAGALQKISYPTGGTTTFDFESNDVYTSVTGQINATIAQMVLLLYGQNSQYTQTVSFTSNGNPITITANNTSNYSGTLSVTNSSSTVVYSNNNVLANATLTTTLNLPAGNYTTTAALPNYSNTAPGLLVTFNQIQTVVNAHSIPVGGLRIKTITHHDGLTSNDQITSYVYSTTGIAGGNSSGVLYSQPSYVQNIRNDLIANEGYWTTTGFQPYSLDPYGCPITGYYYKSPSSIRPMTSVQGNHIGYQRVTVSQTGNGSSAYYYYTGNGNYSLVNGDVALRSISSTGCNSSTPNYPAAPLPFDTKRGELYYEQYLNNSGQLLKEIYYYTMFDEAPVLSTPAFIVSTVLNTNYNLLLGTRYTLNAVRKIKTVVTENDHGQDGNGLTNSITTTYYGSNFHNQPTRSVTTTSTTDSLITKTKYAFDFRIPSCDAVSDCSSEYNTACTSCQTTYNSARTTCAGNSSCLTTAFLNYQLCLTNARISYTTCRKTNYMNTNSTYNTCIASAESGGSTELKPILNLQDEFRNAPIEVSDWKDSNLLHANFTRYDYVTTPAGIPYPNKTQLINLQSPSTTFNNSAVSGSTITKDSRYLDEAFYVFSGGNPAQVTGHNGVPTSYIWDYLNSEPVAKVSNATADQIAYTSFEADGKGGWTFSGTPAADASAITGGKDYTLNGSNNITKTGLATTKSFIVSYWSKTGSATVNGASASLLFTKNGWSYYEHKLSAGISSVTVSGSVTIDELRLYPSDAQMTSYTYNPLVGMTSGSGPTGILNYYEFDALGRLVHLRDMDKNIVKQFDYKYNVPASAYLNSQQSGTFTRNNCSSGYIGGAVTYIVPASTYGSDVSQASADLQATNDVSANGQNYANTNGTCSLPPETVTGSNSTTKSVSISMTNTSTSTVYTATSNAGGSGVLLVTVPSGTYNITMTPSSPASNYYLSFSFNSNNQTNYNAVSFSNIAVTSAATVNITSGCSGSNCPSPLNKCIVGVCQPGVKEYTSSVLQGHGQYLCTYVYAYPDGTYSSSYQEVHTGPCPITLL